MKSKQHTGKLFVFEGPDGSGKTTLSSAFVAKLEGSGIECEHFSFPGQESGSLGQLVYDLHHEPKEKGVHSLTPTSLQLMHIAAHLDTIESRILPALKRHRTIVLDRFWWSTWVYGKVSGVPTTMLKAMLRLEQLAWKNVQPDAIFLIRRNLPLHKITLPEYEKLLAEYDALANRQPRRNVVVVNNQGSVPNALATIISTLRGHENPGISNGPLSSMQRGLPLGISNNLPSPMLFSRHAPVKTTIVFDTYWRFATERQEIFFRRLAGNSPPWTNDPILLKHKFTNAYRASDRVSQYLIRQVIYTGDPSVEEVFFRTLLFKFFNKIETWELLSRKLGTLSFGDYSFRRYDAILTGAIDRGQRIYSAAYIMPSGGRSANSQRKHQMHLKLLERMMDDALPSRLSEASSMREAFTLLRSYPTIGDFLAYQYVTDLNYSNITSFSEMEFVVPGPGARDGIRKCFADLGEFKEDDIIKMVTDNQQAQFERLGLNFKSLWGRPLQLIDCQSLFCEVDKYSRVAHADIPGITGRTRIKQKYSAIKDSFLVWYPPKWGLNDRIDNEIVNVPNI
ncbi:MAG: nucleotide kinase domain-containing protein [Halobacteriota archaeon]